MDKKTIFVRNFLTNCSIGIYPKEQKKKQKVKMSVSLELRKVKAKDTIESTISYENIIILLKEVKHFHHINLLETLARKLLDKLLENKNIKKIHIEIIKCNILKGEQEVGVTIEKTLK